MPASRAGHHCGCLGDHGRQQGSWATRGETPSQRASTALVSNIDFEAWADYLGDATANGLSRWRGEMRSAARANLLPSVVSARIDLKAACGRAERWLERYRGLGDVRSAGHQASVMTRAEAP